MLEEVLSEVEKRMLRRPLSAQPWAWSLNWDPVYYEDSKLKARRDSTLPKREPWKRNFCTFWEPSVPRRPREAVLRQMPLLEKQMHVKCFFFKSLDAHFLTPPTTSFTDYCGRVPERSGARGPSR